MGYREAISLFWMEYSCGLNLLLFSFPIFHVYSPFFFFFAIACIYTSKKKCWLLFNSEFGMKRYLRFSHSHIQTQRKQFARDKTHVDAMRDKNPGLRMAIMIKRWRRHVCERCDGKSMRRESSPCLYVFMSGNNGLLCCPGLCCSCGLTDKRKQANEF